MTTPKAATYEYMDWCRKYQRTRDRYMAWRQYIQRMTEKGMQEEAMAETVEAPPGCRASPGQIRIGLWRNVHRV
ncbi:hypothetical protein NIB75_21490 [Bacteroides uniformis]|nr:hypothetical protein [Bacteroides uniformis]